MGSFTKFGLKPPCITLDVEISPRCTFDWTHLPRLIEWRVWNWRFCGGQRVFFHRTVIEGYGREWISDLYVTDYHPR
jgi:hypothetical protein